MTRRPRVAPIPRINPSGRKVWIARYPLPDGRRLSAGTFARKGEAQDAIDHGLERVWEGPRTPDSFGAYAQRWPTLHPRSQRTDATNRHRITRVLDVEVEGAPLRNWLYRDLRRRHAHALVDALLTRQKRTATGAQNILRTLSAMSEDAITDDVAEVNPFKGVRVRASDPRVTKRRREVRVWTFEQMHAFAAACGTYEGLVRCFSDCGLRLGEALPLRRCDLISDPDAGWLLAVRRTAHEGVVTQGTKTDHDADDPGRLTPVSAGHLAIIQTAPRRIDTDLLWPTPTGLLWRERNFYRDVWQPAREETAMEIRPHEMRHSWVTHMRAAGVIDADLAEAAGHGVDTMLARYTHSIGTSYDAMRRAGGQ